MNIFNLFKKNKEFDYEKILFKEENANTIKNNIKLLVISDTHGYLYEDKTLRNKLKSIKEYDLCCILGDIHDNDYKIILDIIDKNKIVALLGNHDRLSLLKEMNIYNINGNIKEINGIRIGGIEGCYKYKDEVFPSFTQEESIKFMNRMPYVDIILSHDKPYRTYNIDNVHNGLKGITKYAYDNKLPLIIHGHTHDSIKYKLRNGTIVKSVYKIELIEISNGKIVKL